ncbi:hypothetical protein EK21DRAFT_111529 [Setomelanomma holmii]|uniref:MYND-type domain-containing protein n=1 Tax=Setomelanomma holmii TaxID=210430 RepID=A0A9P4HCJ3_9PLEO|nr:hypothetical protein EK21DRAFT_111529 [Setomelanomma holmii]
MASTQNPHDQRGPFCAMCPRPGIKFKDCLEIRYCSVACEARDWPIHKLVCKSSRSEPEGQRPDGNYKRAILFPQNEPHPRFFWLSFVSPNDSEYDYNIGHGAEYPYAKVMLGVNPLDYSQVATDILDSVVPKRPLENPFRIMGKHLQADSAHDVPKHEVNQSLLSINAELKQFWYGTVIAYGLRSTNNGPFRCYDMGAVEFRHVVDAMRSKYDQFQATRIRKVVGVPVMGVRVTTAADRCLGNCQPIEPFPVNVSLRLANSDIAAPIYDRIGIPLGLHRLPSQLTERDRYVELPCEVSSMAPLLQHIDPPVPLLDRNYDFGSIIAVRKDGKPLYPVHMAAFMDYERDKLAARFARKGTYNLEKLSEYSKEDFVKWYESWKKLQLAEGKIIDEILSPHEV